MVLGLDWALRTTLSTCQGLSNERTIVERGTGISEWWTIRKYKRWHRQLSVDGVGVALAMAKERFDGASMGVEYVSSTHFSAAEPGFRAPALRSGWVDVLVWSSDNLSLSLVGRWNIDGSHAW